MRGTRSPDNLQPATRDRRPLPLRLLRLVGPWIALGLALLAVAVLLVVRRSFPQVDGEMVLPGLTAEATVIRDRHGTPHIYASTFSDLVMAQGFVEAQDRFWQMDFYRHVATGRTAEMFGEAQVEADIFLRTLGWEQVAVREYQALSPFMQSLLDAYAQGVNAYLAERGKWEISLEYAFLGIQNPDYQPMPWKPTDTLAFAKVVAWDLRTNIVSELERAVLSESIPIERVSQLWPAYPEGHPVIVPGWEPPPSSPQPTGAALPSPSVREASNALGEAVVLPVGADRVGLVLDNRGRGSNSWVVAGRHTVSGAPLLANDPHLGGQTPSIWYRVGLHCRPVSDSCPVEAAGFSLPGTPLVTVGHNGFLAWGFTNLGGDVSDLFIERVHPEDPLLYEVDGEWLPMSTRTETIEVANADPVEITIRETHHGPVISGIYDPVDELEGNGVVDLPDPYAASLAWTALQTTRNMEAVLGMVLARSWEEFRSAAALFDMAPLNMVYADADGNIGYQATGLIPVREAGDGRYPAPGWESQYDWQGFWPFETLPWSLNPPSGMVVAANQPLARPDLVRHIGSDFDYGYRARRIHELLAGSLPLDTAGMSAIQFDHQDPSAAFLVPALAAVGAGSENVAVMQDLLTGWMQGERPGQMDSEAAAAAAYAATWRHLLALTFDELPEGHEAHGGSRFMEVVRALLESPEDPWWDRTGTERRETRDLVLHDALEAAHAELVELMGDNPEDWRWGDIHTGVFNNASLGESGVSLIESVFNRHTDSVSGGSGTVNATQWIASEGYETDGVPSFRMVIDLGDPDASLSIHVPGQSGHAYHPHYDDLLEPWAAGEMQPLPWDRDTVESLGESTLVLRPAP
ncbi:MAG: penicillin acylase family protein [bacterium]|nr:penicillin acylase family protein [bacterium]MDE0602338.1 penicillin acylase family protein [bacterium]